MQPRVFLDTTVLLKGLAAVRKGVAVPIYLWDANASRVTFEKCLVEAYMAFRGVGGKKPDEGRGRWAEMNLTMSGDPASLSKLSSQFHGGRTTEALWWLNQVLELEYGLEEVESTMQTLVIAQDQSAAFGIEALKGLTTERSRYEALCSNFDRMLERHNIGVVRYDQVFGEKFRFELCRLGGLLNLAKDSAIASEDFEIIVAALISQVDIFVTDDVRLINTAFSLGGNLPLHVAKFCRGGDYQEKVSQWASGCMVAET